MKSYKLIKNYPSLPKHIKVGSCVTLIIKLDEYVFTSKKSFSREEIENHPEFWEEVKESKKQLQYKVTSTTYLTAASPEPSIKSITRLSDNRSFQIRDRVNGGVIKEFILDEKYDGGLKIIISDTNSCSLNYLCMELPIYKSEDGVDMYNGDPAWKIKEDGSIKCFKMQNSIGHISTYPLLFSTIEAAMDYKRANKKSISLNNVLSFCDEIGINKYLAYDYFKQY